MISLRVHCFIVWLVALAVILTGCAGAPGGPSWRDDAASRFATAIAAGVETFAPDETDSIRQTIALGDRYSAAHLPEDAEPLYQLASQKSRLLYRHLLASTIRDGSVLTVEPSPDMPPEMVIISRDTVSVSQLIEQPGPHTPPSPAPSPTHQDASGPETPSASPPDQAGKRPDQPEKSATKKTAKKALPTPQPLHQAGSIPAREIGRITIYLTFDDGPSRLTLPIADYLASQGVKATFFALGSNIPGHEKTLSKTIALGHRVGNHTLSHNLLKLKNSFESEHSEVARTAAMLDRLGGDGKLVRIPYGASDRALVSRVAAEGGQVIDWDINSNDSTRRGAKDAGYIEQTVLGSLQRSGKRHIVMLFHDGAGHETTLKALRSLIPKLKQQGYHFGVLSRSETVAARVRPNAGR